MIKKIITPSNNSNSNNVDYRSTGKIANKQPLILESFVDDDGEINFILDNGRTTLEKNYQKMWEIPKGKIDWKAKGNNPDTRRI